MFSFSPKLALRIRRRISALVAAVAVAGLAPLATAVTAPAQAADAGAASTAPAGYWLVASDGGIFAFGSAPFRGSMGSVRLAKPVTGMVRYGNGYMMVAADGGVFDFSDRPFAGSLGNNPPANPIVFAATLDS